MKCAEVVEIPPEGPIGVRWIPTPRSCLKCPIAPSAEISFDGRMATIRLDTTFGHGGWVGPTTTGIEWLTFAQIGLVRAPGPESWSPPGPATAPMGSIST